MSRTPIHDRMAALSKGRGHLPQCYGPNDYGQIVRQCGWEKHGG